PLAASSGHKKSVSRGRTAGLRHRHGTEHPNQSRQGDLKMTLTTMRRLGAIPLLIVGAVHLQQYVGNDYSVLPTIGPLFLLNAIGAGIVAICLLAPIERILK